MGLKGCGARIAVVGPKLWIVKVGEFFERYLYDYDHK